MIEYAKWIFTIFFMLVWHIALAESHVGVVERIQGNAQVVYADGSDAIAIEDEIYKGDKITTQKDTELVIRMIDGTVLAMRPNTQITLTDFKFNRKNSKKDNMLVKLLKGGMRIVTGAIGKKNPKKVKFKTPTATIGIRGTDFELSVIEAGGAASAGTYNKVYYGATYLENAQGKRVEVMPNQVAYSPIEQLKIAHQFGLLDQAPPPEVFQNGSYDQVLESLQQETMRYLNEDATNMPNKPESKQNVPQKLLRGNVPTGHLPGGEMMNGKFPGVEIPNYYKNSVPDASGFGQ